MDKASVIFLLGALVSIGYQAYVTVLLARSGMLTKWQLAAQSALIWLLPLVGAAICHWFFKLNNAYERPRELGHSKGDTYNGVENAPVNDLLP